MSSFQRIEYGKGLGWGRNEAAEELGKEVMEATIAREDAPDIQKMVWLSQIDHALL